MGSEQGSVEAFERLLKSEQKQKKKKRRRLQTVQKKKKWKLAGKLRQKLRKNVEG